MLNANISVFIVSLVVLEVCKSEYMLAFSLNFSRYGGLKFFSNCLIDKINHLRSTCTLKIGARTRRRKLSKNYKRDKDNAA